MNRKLFFVAVVLLACTLVSCERENLSSKFNNDGKIGVIVSGTEGVATKAGNTVELIGSTLLEDIDGLDLRLDAYVEENDMMPFAEAVDTKGSIVTTTSINTKDQTFAFHGWLGSTNRYPNDVDNGRTYEEGGSTGRVNNANDENNYHFLNAIATKGDEWTLSSAVTDKDLDDIWRNNVPTTFWSYYPVGTSGITLPVAKAADAAQAKVAFAYTTPTAVADQKDVLFAYNQHTVEYDNDGKTKDSETVDIHFYHALAAIRFDISGLKNLGCTITDIYFKDVVTAGQCAITGGSSEKNKPGTVSFAWTPDATKKATVSQAFSADDFTEDGLDRETEKALMPLSSSKFFFLIPQEIKDQKVLIGIKYTDHLGVAQERTFTLDHSQAWEAGKIYTYKLSPAELVDVDVLETVTANVKSDVKIKNTGNVAEFLRVAIVGNWVVKSGEAEILVKSWSYNAADFKNLNTADWTYSNGYFYSKEAVEPGDELDLFEEFKAPGAPVDGATLNLYIMSQAVAAGTASNWDAAVAATTSNE